MYVVLAVYWVWVVPALGRAAAGLPALSAALLVPPLYACTYGVQAVVVWWLLARPHPGPLAASANRPGPGLQLGAAALFAGIAAAATWIGNPGLTGAAGRLTGHAALGLAGLDYLIVAVAEEYLFRGVVLRALTRLWGPPAAVVLAALAFAAFHFGEVFLNPAGTGMGPGPALTFVGYFASAVMAGAIVWRGGSLPLVIVLHWLGDWSPWAPNAASASSGWSALLPWLFYPLGLAVAEGLRRPARRHRARLAEGPR